MNNHRFPEVIEWFKAGKVDPAAIITHRFKMEEAEKGFAIGKEHPEDTLKVILTF